MGLFLSFLGGAAQSFSEELEKSEKEAKNSAILGVKAMTERYEKVAEDNRKLKEKLDADKEFILSYHPNATPEQVNELIARPTVMEAFRKYKDPSSISLDSLVKISAGNPSVATAAERVAALPDMIDRSKELLKSTLPKRVSPLGQVFDEFGERAFTATQEKALTQTAQALGISVEDLKSQRRLTRPAARGEVDMSVFAERDEPKSIDEVVKRLDLNRYNIAQKFGKDSQQYKDAEAKLAEAKGFIDKTDRSLEARLDRLNIAAMDNPNDQDLKRQVKETQQAIRLNKEATAAKTDEEKKKTYSGIRTSVNDYVNNRMRQEEGASWRQYVEYSTMQLPDGSTYIGKTMKKMPVEAQRAMFERERQLTEEALKVNGYVTVNGVPRYPAVAEIMNNMNIPIAGQQTATMTPAQINQARKEANDAIAKGASRESVAQRFKQSTGQEL